MTGFALDGSGDVVMGRRDIETVSGTELLAQKIRQVLGTNQGEWWLDPKEGIPVREVLKKGPNPAMVRDYVRSAVAQVDASLELTRCEVTSVGRTLQVYFEVSGADGTASAGMEVR